jgi:hypothetical protein
MREGYSRGSCIYQNKEKNGAAYPLWVYAVQERKRAMERLTHPRSSGIKTKYWSPNKKDELVERLAAYEDTDLTPQEIYSLKAGTILKALRTEWIPVEERLPEDGTYLCTLDGELCGLDEPFTGMCGIENGKWDEEGCVIAWMPLPEPYQGK